MKMTPSTPRRLTLRHRIDGLRRRAGSWWHAALLGAAMALVAQPVSALEVKALMALLAGTPEGKATFVEERTVTGFDAPMTASGELYFKAPHVFERRTLKPSAESMLVNGNTMTLARGGRSRQMALNAAPEAAAIVGAVRGTLVGDAKTLEQYFRLSLSGQADAWLLDLVPRDGSLSASVRQVQMRGSQGVVRGVEIWFANGDRSLMTITPLAQ